MVHPLLSIPLTLLLIHRARTHNSLTTPGILLATLTALLHALHPWSAPFLLLITFYLLGTRATKLKHDVKARLTHSSSGAPGGEGPRTAVQVLANSVAASAIILLHLRYLARGQGVSAGVGSGDGGKERDVSVTCWRKTTDILPLGIIANYAAVTADTLSSELGILSRTPPFLILPPFRRVPRGTNGGVTLTGLLAGAGGAFIIALAAVVLFPFCAAGTPWGTDGMGWPGGMTSEGLWGWEMRDKMLLVGGVTIWGTLGSVLDSVLGATLQRSVTSTRTGKIIEGDGGGRVRVESSGFIEQGGNGGGKQADGREGRASRKVENGWDVLDNNGVNLTMACTMTVGAVLLAAWWWGVPLRSVIL